MDIKCYDDDTDEALLNLLKLSFFIILKQLNFTTVMISSPSAILCYIMCC